VWALEQCKPAGFNGGKEIAVTEIAVNQRAITGGANGTEILLDDACVFGSAFGNFAFAGVHG